MISHHFFTSQNHLLTLAEVVLISTAFCLNSDSNGWAIYRPQISGLHVNNYMQINMDLPA